MILSSKSETKEWRRGVEYGNANVPVNMFVAKRNINGKVDILLAVFLGEYNNASQFFRMEIS
jgi:hypothetical protein